MKRNMLPLFGIAFVVAIICTGVFYGVFAGKLQSSAGELAGHSIVVAARDLDRGTVVGAGDLRLSEARGALSGAFSKIDDVAGATLLAPVKANEPLLEERVASRTPKSGGAGGMVPSGMRAISLKVSESDGLLGLLQPGSRVDVQAVSEKSGVTELRNVLDNVEVLAVNPQPQPTSNRGPVSIVTVLIPAESAGAVALADSGGRVRLTLRNPQDKGAPAGKHSGSAAASPAEAAHAAQNAGGWDHPVQVRVEVLGASEAALGELASKVKETASDDSLRVAAFHPGEDAEQLVRSLEQKHELEVVARERLTAGVGRPISFRAGSKPYQMRVQFAPETSGGSVNLRMKPEISVPSGDGQFTRKYDAGVSKDASYLVNGWLKSPADRQTLEHLFPGHSWEHRQLVVLVTARALTQRGQ